MDKLKLNTLERFSKRSDQLLLEHYSHCEVPAGCGGVILRWRERAEGALAELAVFCPRQVAVSIDGQSPPSARLLLPWGAHVLTATVSRLPRKGALLLSLMTKPRHRTQENKSVPPEAVLCSAPDGSWRYTTDEPAPQWQHPDFDDRSWLVMRPVPPPVSPDGRVPWLVRSLVKNGAQPIGVLGTPERLWIRRRFVLEGP